MSHMRAAAAAMHMDTINKQNNGSLLEQNLMCHKAGNILFAFFITYVSSFLSNKSSAAQDALKIPLCLRMTFNF